MVHRSSYNNLNAIVIAIRRILLLVLLSSRTLPLQLTGAAAFQPPSISMLTDIRWHDTNTDTMKNTNTNSRTFASNQLEQEEECHTNGNCLRKMETRLYSERRQFVRRAASLATAGFLTHTTALLYTPAVAAAKDAQPPVIVGADSKIKKPKGLGGLPKKIRVVGRILDELQRDLMQERWDLVEKYPEQLRSYVPIFTKFTDVAFPSDSSTDKGLRVALRYEVGRFFASLVRLRKATTQKSLDEAFVAYSDMSLHFDRYLRVGGLYTYYDATISTEGFFDGFSDSIQFANQKKDPPLVRDLVVLTKGPDMGKTGIVIGIYLDDSKNCVVKLDRFMGLREIRIVPLKWVGKRVGEQDPDDVLLIPREDADSLDSLNS